MNPIIKVPANLTELEKQYPKAYRYLLAKEPTSIVLKGATVLLTNSKTGFVLAYDTFDLEIFNRAEI